MELILHIGCEKTGTTAVQNWLARHGTTLRERGIFYSRALGRANNRRISFYGLDPGTPDEGLALEGIATEAQLRTFQAQIAEDLIGEVHEAAECDTKIFVISNEHCHSRLKTQQTVNRVRDLLTPLFDRITVICFLRPQIDMCLSLASTMTRNGAAVSRDWVDKEMRTALAYYDFDRLLRRWAEAFGTGAILALPFARHRDCIGYFETLLGVADLALKRPRATNAAVDYRVIAMVNALNAANPDQRFGEFPRLYFNQLPVEQRLRLDRASAQALQARFDAINAAVCAHWPTIEPSDLLPDWASYPEQGNIDRLDMAIEIGPMLRQLIDRLQADAVFERAKVLALTSEREVARGQTAFALESCAQGLTLARSLDHIEDYRGPIATLIANLERRIALLTEKSDNMGARLPARDEVL